MVPAKRVDLHLVWWLAVMALAGMLTILLSSPLGRP